MNPSWAKYARKTLVNATFGAFVMVPACCVLSAGCNNGRQLQSDLYQRELRLQEDEIYRLEDYVDEYQEIIQGYRCELAETRRRLEEKQDAKFGGSTRQRIETLPEPTPALPDTPEPLDLDGAESDILPDIEFPEPETPLPAPTDATAPKKEAPKFNAAPLFETSRREGSDKPGTRLASLETDTIPNTSSDKRGPRSGHSPPAPYPHAPIEKPIEPPTGLDDSIALRLVPGPDVGQGPTTLTTIVTATAESLEGFRGTASVMLTDPSIEGGRRRIARWDFTEAEVVEAWRTTNLGVLEFPIALPTNTPTDQALRVWVRLTEANGRKRLQAASLRLADNRAGVELASTAPRRLPSIVTPSEPAALPIAEIETAQPIDQWRPASHGQRDRTIDPALLPASFETE